MPPGGDDVQRPPAPQVPALHVGAALQEQVGDPVVPVEAGDVERRGAVFDLGPDSRETVWLGKRLEVLCPVMILINLHNVWNLVSNKKTHLLDYLLN